MARPRRLRAQIDSALIRAEQLCAGSLARLCQEYPPASRQCTEKLLELVEALARAMVLHQDENITDLRQLVELSQQFVERQLDRLSQQEFHFVSGRGLQAFFLLQLFERLRQEVVSSAKEQFVRSASAAYFTPIDLSYYLVRAAFSAKENWHKQSHLLDFCAGSGALSIAALDYLASGQKAERLSLLSKHIFAVEIDPLILRSYIACLSVACGCTIEETMAAASVQQNFVVADGLSSELPNKFDLVLSNPPWQGSSSYLPFVERSAQLLAPGAVAAVLTPQGIISDQGATRLRQALFKDFHWQSCEGFTNEDLAFDIHPSFKYALSIFAKPRLLDHSSLTRVRFGSVASRSLAADTRAWCSYSFDLARLFSPSSFAIVECDSQNQLALFKAVTEKNVPLHVFHENGQMQMERGRYRQSKMASTDFVSRAFYLRFARDFDMSLDKEYFITPSRAREAGFKADCYGRHLLGKWQDLERESALSHVIASSDLILSQDQSSYIERDQVEECLLPLIEGRMLNHFDIASKVYIAGCGRQALWHESSLLEAQIAPQYLLRQADFCQRRSANENTRIGFISVSAPTNTRSMVAALLPSFPAGNSVPFLAVSAATESDRAYCGLITVSVLNSFVFDFVLRTRFSGNNLNYFLLDQCSVPQALLEPKSRERQIELDLIAQVAALLSLSHLSLASTIWACLNGLTEVGFFASELVGLTERAAMNGNVRLPWPQRQRLRALLDALVARLYGLSREQFAEILSGCIATASTREKPLEYSRGFHRVDKQLDLGQRLPNLAYQIFQDIEMNRLDLNRLAKVGFTLAQGASGHRGSFLEENEERFREHMAWLKLHQNRLNPFHQKSGVK